jgi:PD-(D/E)XK nuclease superfamily protein
MEWTPNQMGAAAEAAIALAATKLEIPVLQPMFIDCRYDFVFALPTGLVRIQCKWAPRRKNVVVVQARTCRRTAGGYERTTYGPEEVDAIAAYCPDVDRCYLIPILDVPPSGIMHLRLAPAKNNQLKRLHSAAEYELDHGAIAQLEERLSGTQEVVGSSPTSSTPEEPRIARLFS